MLAISHAIGGQVSVGNLEGMPFLSFHFMQRSRCTNTCNEVGIFQPTSATLKLLTRDVQHTVKIISGKYVTYVTVEVAVFGWAGILIREI